MAHDPTSDDRDGLLELQRALAGRVVLRDRFPTPLRTVAGFAVELDPSSGHLHAAAVLMDADRQQVIARTTASVPAFVPEIEGLRSFRVLPALLDALRALPSTPDLAFVQGHGIAHPSRLGVAAHFGVAADVPSIGVATERLVGDARLALHEMRGAFTPLRDEGAQIGWLLRSAPGLPPLVVSPGHRVAMPSAPELVMRFVAGARLPTPLRLARALLHTHTPSDARHPT